MAGGGGHWECLVVFFSMVSLDLFFGTLWRVFFSKDSEGEFGCEGVFFIVK